ncbi:MAG: DUF4288 domain-containing protein [Chitinophagaceae bacterium]|jgi:hypothetical protein|nr:MAG: DUF4288 domain-containing protein [Chitinophagaceae bacterium]
MNWYLAKIVFRIVTEKETAEGLFEEKLRLINSGNKRDALMDAHQRGEEEASVFINAAGDKIEWQFIAVSELKPIEILNDGIELDSRLTEMPCDEFISLMRHKENLLFLEDETVVYY